MNNRVVEFPAHELLQNISISACTRYMEFGGYLQPKKSW